MTAPPRHLLSLRDLPAERWNRLLVSAESLSGPHGRQSLLRGRRLGMVFFNPSLRTRTAFEVACFDLGAHAVYLQVGGGLWNLEHRTGVRMDGDAAEHVKEGFGVLSRMLDGVGVRVFAGLKDAAEDAKEPVLGAIARASSVPIWNLESATDHPHQGLADALVLRRALGGKKARVVVTWAPHVKPLPMAVPNAALLAFAREGHEVVLARPEGYDLADEVVADAKRWAALAGGSVTVTADREAAFRGARAVYAKSWGARAHYGDAKEAADGFARNAGWIVDARSMAWTAEAKFMHCLPVRRNVVVTDEVIDSPRSIIFDQAECRLHVQKATLVDSLEAK